MLGTPGVHQNDINAATSFLIATELLRINQVASKNNQNQYTNIYRLVGIDSYNHIGTTGKQDPEILITENS